MLKRIILSSAILALTACGADSSTAAEQSNQSKTELAKTKAPETKTSETQTSETKAPKQDITTQKLSDGMYMPHYHGDHAGANAQMKEAGATIMAHENVRKRMGMTFENKAFGRTVKATDPSLWPTLTFSEKATLHFNGQTVTAIHTPKAHTDGDSIIYFKEANLLHMGDNFFNGMFPYIDIDGGGSLQGMIASHETALSLINDETTIIPGHGPLAVKADLKKTQDILKDIQKRVESEISKGATLDDILEKDLLKDLSSYSSFIDTVNMVKFAHRSLTQ